MNVLRKIRARVRALAWKAALRIADGELVEDRGEAEDLVFQLGRFVRDEIETLPRLLARTLATESSPKEVEILLERELNNALRRAAERAEWLSERSARASS